MNLEQVGLSLYCWKVFSKISQGGILLGVELGVFKVSDIKWNSVYCELTDYQIRVSFYLITDKISEFKNVPLRPLYTMPSLK